MSRFFVDRHNINEDRIFITDKDDVKHLSKVLRHKIGDIIEISDNIEYEYTIELGEINSSEASGKILTKSEFLREPELRITLYQGIPKQGKMELIIQKTVELGTAEIIPVFTERTVVQDKGNFEKKTERWQKIADEASKQCRRGKIPAVKSAVTLSAALELMKEKELVLFFYEDENRRTLKEFLKEISKSNHEYKDLGIIIGPEGGFSQQEAEKIAASGAVSVSMGKTILRVETASVAAMAMVMYELEQ